MKRIILLYEMFHMMINNQKLKEFHNSGRMAVLKDVAEIAGCSLSAVSTTLNNSISTTGVSADKRQTILKVAELLNYRPNFAARSLVSRQSKTIGVCISRAERRSSLGPFYEAPMLQGMELSARSCGYDLLLVDSRDCVEKFAENRMDALVLLTGMYGQEELDEILVASPNVIAIDHAPNEKIAAVVFDNFAAIRLAVEHLVSLGHRRIGFAGNLHKNPMADVTTRRDAFLEILKGMSLSVEKMVFDVSMCNRPFEFTGDYCMAEGRMAAEYFVSLDVAQRPTAVICYNDVVAAGAMDVFIQASLELPCDMSVVGIDNSQICDFLRPALTSVRHPLEEMGDLAICHLMEKLQLNSAIRSNPVTILQPELVVRNSTARVK